ncbi:MAG: DUF4032 domain-containing protein [Vulcanimicrobiota bacterium]
MSQHFLEFNEEYEKERPVSSFDLGIVDVPLVQIVGTVGRYRDFDKGLNAADFVNGTRLRKLREALVQGVELPPLELYKLKEHYFIVDGHHRVVLAGKAGKKTLKAHVIEHLPPRNSLDNLLARERSEFELKTGLNDVPLTELAQYEKLLCQIREHKHFLSEREKHEISFKDAAHDWCETIYTPIAARIEEEDILRDYPDRTAADLYVYISDHKWMESRRKGYDIGFSLALQHFHRHRSPEKTLRDHLKDLFSPFITRSRRRKIFQERTGLRDIILSDEKGYSKLQKQIIEHKYYLSQRTGREVSLDEAASQWRYEIFEPVRKVLEEERFLFGFSRKTPADLYLMLSDLKWFESEKRGYDIGFEAAMEEFRKQRHDSRSIRDRVRNLLKTLRDYMMERETHGGENAQDEDDF